MPKTPSGGDAEKNTEIMAPAAGASDKDAKAGGLAGLAEPVPPVAAGGVPASPLVDAESIEKARAEIAREREALEKARGQLTASRADFDKYVRDTDREIENRARQILDDARARAGEVVPSGMAPAQTSTSKLAGLATTPTRVASAAARSAIDVDDPAYEDEYSEVFRGPFVAKARIMVDESEIRPGTIIPAGTAPRSELQPLLERRVIAPYVPPTPALPKARRNARGLTV